MCLLQPVTSSSIPLSSLYLSLIILCLYHYFLFLCFSWFLPFPLSTTIQCFWWLSLDQLGVVKRYLCLVIYHPSFLYILFLLHFIKPFKTLVTTFTKHVIPNYLIINHFVIFRETRYPETPEVLPTCTAGPRCSYTFRLSVSSLGIPWSVIDFCDWYVITNEMCF